MTQQIPLKFRAKAKLSFNRELGDEDAKAITAWIRNDAPVILSRGAGTEEGARVSAFSFAGYSVSIEIESGRSVRAHDALGRIRKGLAAGPCRERSLGLRSVDVESYDVEVLGNDLPVLRLPFVKDVSRTDGGVLISLSLTEREVREQVVDRIIRLYMDKVERSRSIASREVHREVWCSGRKENPWGRDPGPELERLGWMKRFAPGVWYYLPPLAHLVRAIERMIVEEVATKNGFLETFFPKLVTLEVMRKKGQLTGIPHEMFYVCEPITREESAFEEYTDKVSVTGDVDTEGLRRLTRPPSYVLPYAQCEPFYEIFAGEIVDLDMAPIKLFDKSGFSYRYEAGGLENLSRLTTFTRIELAFIGSPTVVSKTRDDLIESYKFLLSEMLGLETRVVEVTPVWMAHAGVVGDTVREVPATYDLEVYLPHKGPRESDAWLEVANSSVHYEKYVEWYRIKEKRDRPIWTGCSGNGLERIAYALFANYGLEPSAWPAPLRSVAGEIPGPFTLVTWPRP